MNLINIVNLSKTYNSPTKEVLSLDNINLDIKEGEILGIVGSSGCGKSTLLNILTELETKTSGQIRKNKDLVIGYMMQNDALLPWLNVYENAIVGLKLKKILNKKSIEYVNNLLKKYDLYEFKNEYPSKLSGGMRQRLALIRTLAIKPNILLLDEPFSKLDIDSRITISDDVSSIIKELNITTILISHDIAEAVSMCDRVVVLSKRPGKIKNIYDISFEENIPSKKRETVNFHELYKKVWNDIDHV